MHARRLLADRHRYRRVAARRRPAAGVAAGGARAQPRATSPWRFSAIRSTRRASYAGDADASFRAVHDLLREHGVQVVMAGDTHDFEYYREPGERRRPPLRQRRRRRLLEHWHGARLAGAAGASRDYAFYPRTDAVAAKLSQETPWWKWPAWWWVRRFGAWPFSVEALSAVFDFNRAPFYQSFMEVRVERSAQPRDVRGARRRRSACGGAMSRWAARRNRPASPMTSRSSSRRTGRGPRLR